MSVDALRIEGYDRSDNLLTFVFIDLIANSSSSKPLNQITGEVYGTAWQLRV